MKINFKKGCSAIKRAPLLYLLLEVYMGLVKATRIQCGVIGIPPDIFLTKG